MTRWFAEGEAEMRAEQEPEFMHRAAERVALREHPAFDPRTCADCSEPVRACACCLECGASNGCECQAMQAGAL